MDETFPVYAGNAAAPPGPRPPAVKDSITHLLPRGQEKLMIVVAADLARRR